MAGLVPAIHGRSVVTDVDPRVKPGDDGLLGRLPVTPQNLTTTLPFRELSVASSASWPE
jgi:hypothetical protein